MILVECLGRSVVGSGCNVCSKLEHRTSVRDNSPSELQSCQEEIKGVCRRSTGLSTHEAAACSVALNRTGKTGSFTMTFIYGASDQYFNGAQMLPDAQISKTISSYASLDADISRMIVSHSWASRGETSIRLL